jgi:hypothetical protein
MQLWKRLEACLAFLAQAKKDLADAKDEKSKLKDHILRMSRPSEEQEWDKEKVASLEREIEK